MVHGKIFIGRLRGGDYLEASAIGEGGVHEANGADQGVHDGRSTLIRRK